MVMLVANVTYPHDAGTKVAKKYLEMMKKYPPDPEIGEMIAICARATNKGIVTLAVTNVKKGKVEEAISSAATQYNEFSTSIDGFKWKINAYLDMAEAYKSVGMEPPE